MYPIANPKTADPKKIAIHKDFLCEGARSTRYGGTSAIKAASPAPVKDLAIANYQNPVEVAAKTLAPSQSISPKEITYKG